ncbi:hypothetical protein BD779DRAFT_1441470, partial [Infundibulicybe gibba]
CPPGQFNPSTGNTPCNKCPAGYYAPNKGTKICTPARAGYYVGVPGSTSDSPCSAGTYSGLTASTECSSCPPGKYCPSDGLSIPLLCLAGRFSTGGNVVACDLCPAGSFNNVLGSTGCCLCCAGRFSTLLGSTSCTSCPSWKMYSAPGSIHEGKCSATRGLYQPATSCLQNQDTRSCPASQPYPTGNYAKRNIYPKTCSTSGHKNCPIFKNTRQRASVLAGYECVDVANDLESCGGCVNFNSVNGSRSEDGGRDCSGIPHVNAVSCSSGRCIIGSCRTGYKVSSDGESCVAKTAFQKQPWK